MIACTTEERRWFLQNVAQGLVDYLGVMEPPVPVEDLLKNPPTLYESDFGVVEMNSELWDATFARLPNQRGHIFVHADLDAGDRRFALARETLSALATSKHGREIGLFELVMPNLRDSAEYFARIILAPPRMLAKYRQGKATAGRLGRDFLLPARAALKRCEDFSEA